MLKAGLMTIRALRLYTVLPTALADGSNRLSERALATRRLMQTAMDRTKDRTVLYIGDIFFQS